VGVDSMEEHMKEEDRIFFFFLTNGGRIVDSKTKGLEC